MADEREMDPETQRIVDDVGRRMFAKRAGKRTVSQLIAEDHTPRPYSVRLTPGEIHRLRGMAHLTDIEASVLARQFILDGLMKLEAQMDQSNADSAAPRRILAVKLALLSVYDLVEGLERVPEARTPSNESPNSTDAEQVATAQDDFETGTGLDG